ncbi:phenylacetaldoxime dehydratase family protein [Sneathiella marina]|uniref:Phenylacetaldoxime dehydratase family protein n=1 Tax=Sneathiella marina TaxID=2950108 RepID=A0ABY4VZZ1_9PROT|nr:phenylacetaldoxime dehydratase family protein [Sneathiella marina]USG60450.1 phenylacetaldoxime dehydratase family protein [Sneathiella marina]
MPKNLEPSIPEHLRVKRTRPLNAADDFVPTHPNYSARFDPRVKTLPMAYFGVQYKKEGDVAAIKAIENLKTGFTSENGPSFWDLADYADEAGYLNSIIVGYWDSRDKFNKWEKGLPSDWWHSGAKLEGELGFFREVYTPGIVDTETTFSHQHPEGYSKIADHMSGDTDTHEYWGSARDRIPRAQTDALAPQGYPQADLGKDGQTLGCYITVEPQENMCLLRSGQDWSETKEEEREFYLKKVKPALDQGMKEIRDIGNSFGCFFNRYMDLHSDDGPTEKSYSLSAWHALSDLEVWVKTKTHLAIFNAGIKHYEKAGADAKLHLYHEMSVVRAKDQSFAYFNCHAKTGLLNAISYRGSKLKKSKL